MTEYYSWRGVPVEVEVYDATEDSHWDVSAIYPEHPTGEVPAGETHFLVHLVAGTQDGWWAVEDAFWEHAEPLGPGAIDRVNDLRSRGLYPR